MKKIFKLFLLLSIAVALFSSSLYAKKELRPPPKSQENPFLQNIEILPQITTKNLTVMPIRIYDNAYIKDIISMEEALNSGALSVIETGDVNNLSLENISKHSVFIMGGEIIQGGKQNRIIQQDLLIPPFSGRIDVAAFCVEHGRWSGASPGEHFNSSKHIANSKVRQFAGEKKDQSSVWDAVEKTNNKVLASAPTGDLSRAFEAPKVQANKDKFIKELHYGIKRIKSINGFVVFVNGELLAVDLFGSPALFEKYRDKLMESYTLEAIAREEERNHPMRELTYSEAYPEKTAKQFLDEASSTMLRLYQKIGSGTLLELKNRNQFGRFLVSGNSLIHAEIFPRSTDTDKQMPPIERQYHRE